MEMPQLLDAAKATAHLPSDLQLGRRIDMAATQIGMWRRGIYYPRDHKMIELCELAEYPPEAGLMWLNAWRADEKAKPIYEKLARDLEKRASKSRKAA